MMTEPVSSDMNICIQSEDALIEELQREGRIWLRDAVSEPDLCRLGKAMRLASRPGERLQGSDQIGTVLREGSSLSHAMARVSSNARPVRLVAFNKSKQKNWGVPWHQDRVIAVSDRHEVAGFKNWSRKSGTWHCEPPTELLHSMLFVRVHLDDTDENNGAMKIALRSHSIGMVLSDEAEKQARGCKVEICSAKRGDVLVLNMLTLHASKPATEQTSRRVLRIDYATLDLPPPLQWQELI